MIQVNLNPQSISQQTHPEVAGQLQGTRSEEGGVGGSPMAGMIPSQNLARPNSMALGNGSHPEEWLLSGS